MGILTRTQFYYGIEITDDNNTISFSETGPELIGTLNNGSYSFTDFITEVAVALNASTENAFFYSTSFDRATRLSTVSCDNAFDLNVSSATVTNTVFLTLGFTGADRTGLLTYEGDTAIGLVYRPQFPLQNYVDESYNKSFIDGAVKESSSGEVEIVSFGLVTKFEMVIDYINDYEHRRGNIIEENLNGLADAISFMDWCIGKNQLEFMKDRDNPAEFSEVLLERTPESRDGIAYKLKEAYSKQLIGYYRTGRLIFRKL